MRVRHDLDQVRDIVEDHEGVRDHEEDIGKVQPLFLPRRQFLEKTDHIIPHESDGPAEKTRQRGSGTGLYSDSMFLIDLKRIAVKGASSTSCRCLMISTLRPKLLTMTDGRLPRKE